MVLREKVKHPGEVCGARSCREEDSWHRRALFMRLLQEAPVFLVILIVVVVERRLFR